MGSGPALAPTATPVVRARTVEGFDLAVGERASAVPTLVHDQGIQVRLTIELAEEVVAAAGARVGHVDVTHAALGVLLHCGAVGLNPVSVAQVTLARESLDPYTARLVVQDRCARNRQFDGLASLAHEGGPGVDGSIHRDAVHGQEVVALVNVHSGLTQGTASIRVPDPPFDDLGDAVSTVFQGVVTTQEAYTNPRTSLHGTTANVGVPAVQLRDDLAQNVVHVIARHAEVDHRAVRIVHSLPIDTVHVLRIEVVPEQAPGIRVDLGPLLTRIDPGVHAVGLDALWRTILLRLANR